MFLSFSSAGAVSLHLEPGYFAWGFTHHYLTFTSLRRGWLRWNLWLNGQFNLSKLKVFKSIDLLIKK